MDSPDLRASDEDRERVAQEIREHFAAGRLTEEELDARVQAAYGARTVGELSTVRADLPALAPSLAAERAVRAQRRSHLQRRLLQQTGGAMMAFLVCTIIWLASGAHGQFWPIWVAIVPAIALFQGGWRLYGPAPDLDRVERDLERREQRDLERSEQRQQLRRRGRAGAIERTARRLDAVERPDPPSGPPRSG